MKKLREAIEQKMYEVGADNIDYSAEKDDRFYDNCSSYIESKNHIIYFQFDAYDCGSGFHVSNIKFDDIWLPNIIEKLNKTNLRYE